MLCPSAYARSRVIWLSCPIVADAALRNKSTSVNLIALTSILSVIIFLSIVGIGVCALYVVFAAERHVRAYIASGTTFAEAQHKTVGVSDCSINEIHFELAELEAESVVILRLYYF